MEIDIDKLTLNNEQDDITTDQNKPLTNQDNLSTDQSEPVMEQFKPPVDQSESDDIKYTVDILVKPINTSVNLPVDDSGKLLVDQPVYTQGMNDQDSKKELICSQLVRSFLYVANYCFPKEKCYILDRETKDIIPLQEDYGAAELKLYAMAKKMLDCKIYGINYIKYKNNVVDENNVEYLEMSTRGRFNELCKSYWAVSGINLTNEQIQ